MSPAEIDAAHQNALSQLRERRTLSGLSRAEYERQRKAIDYRRFCALETLARGHRPDA